MKNKVLNYLRNSEESEIALFAMGLNLYRDSEEKNVSLEGFYNRAGFSEENLQGLKYELQKIHGISDEEIAQEEIPQEENILFEEEFTGSDGAPERGIRIVKEDIFATAPDQIKESFKLREEFPFLSDANCPDEFHILTGKMFAHYDAWLTARKAFFTKITDINEDASLIAMTSEEITALALRTVGEFHKNDMIWKELNYYKETGKVLGNHPVFIERKLKDKVEALTVENATKRIANLDNYIRRDSKKLEELTGEKKEKMIKKIDGWQIELKMIKTKFNFSE